MTTKDLYIYPEDCCGCEACAQICPKNNIEMRQDLEGFYYPSITNEDNCVNCGRCIAVCPMKNPSRKTQGIRNSFGGYSNDHLRIRQSASGGFAYTISSLLISHGGVVYGVRYSENDIRMIEYTRCDTMEQLLSTRGSKYVQSRKKIVFKLVQKDLKNGLIVLFIGLPCEVAALYRFLGNNTDNLYTINLICHGPTSMKVHSEFISQLLKENKHSLIKDFSVRYKKTAWKPYFIHAVFEDNTNYCTEFANTEYGVAFQNLKRPSCAKCRFKVYDKDFGISADLTIGDFHLAQNGMPHYNSWGSSQVSSHSDKGDFLLEMLKKDMTLFPITEKEAVLYNKAFYKPTYVRWNRRIFSAVFIRKGLKMACEHWSVSLINDFVKIKRLLKGIIASWLRKIRH